MKMFRNEMPGNWAVGVSRSAELKETTLHFAIWHVTFRI